MTVESKQRRKDFIDLPCINKNRQKERNIEKRSDKELKETKASSRKEGLKRPSKYYLLFFRILPYHTEES